MSDGEETPTPARGVFCNRTLNLRGVRAIGYDMDYTLIHYDVAEWEREAFVHARAILGDRGWPVGDMTFDPDAFTLGLVFDLELGNLVKASRFGYVVRAQHGAHLLHFDEHREAYQGTVIDLSAERFEFMNTMFELSRASLWTQLVDRHDLTPLPGVMSYGQLYREIDIALRDAHWAGELKAAIVADPNRFVKKDPSIVSMLQDQRLAGKQTLLITNSDWPYTQRMMSWCFDRHVPADQTWRDLFDLIIVAADKPRFFSDEGPIYEVVDQESSLLAPHLGELETGRVYHGGNARMLEAALGHRAAQFLYVGDHLFGDVHVTKDLLRWRTALIARELEDEIEAAAAFADESARLQQMMADKSSLEHRQAQLRLTRRRAVIDEADRTAIEADLDEVSRAAAALDDEIAPLAQAASTQGNRTWGPLMRAGADKSLFARQVERYADVYTSRVSNLRFVTPYAYLRAARGSLPHDDASHVE